MDNLFPLPKKREIGELNLVPVIDMFMTVIFFLLLSTTFIAFNKLTLPPAGLAKISADQTPPLAATMTLKQSPVGLVLTLKWTGTSPGETSAPVTSPANDPAFKPELISLSQKLASEFHQKFPAEKTLRLGLAGDLDYQDLISVMDGARESLPDVVLVSYAEVAP